MGFEKTATGRLIVEPREDWSALVVDRLRDSGGSSDMVVDGSSTPVPFTFDADATDDLLVIALRIVFVPSVLKFRGENFGALGELTNGVRLQATHDSGTTTELGNLKLSEDFLFLGHPTLETGLSENDLLSVDVPLGGLRLVAGTGDQVEALIRDDVTSGPAAYTRYFQAAVFARKD